MTDINSPLTKAYYDRLKDQITVASVTGFVKVYTGEEPDNVQDQAYIVLGDINDTDNSTKQCTGTISSIQVSIYTWENKYNSAKTVNSIAAQIYTLINPTPQSTITAAGIGVISTKIQNDRTERIGVLAGRKFINRILIFSHYIYI